MDERLETEPLAAPAISWGAVFAGAAAAAALSLILVVLGVGLGLSAVSPWTARGASATTLGVSTILWISFTALVASGAGGYIAGRLRSRWRATHTDEVYFRDTAHGFLAWAVATLVTAGMLASAVGSVVAGGAQVAGSALAGAGAAATSAIGGAAAAVQGGDSADGSTSTGTSLTSYFVDSLFRPAAAGAPAGGASAAPMAGLGAGSAGGSSAAATSAEVARIFARSLQSGSISQDDTRYVAQLVEQRTGMSQAEAERRVADVYGRAQQSLREAEAKAREAADQARKATAYGSLWVFVSLLLGAFAASLLATFGGRQRDQQP